MGLLRWWWYRPGCSVLGLVVGFLVLLLGLRRTGVLVGVVVLALVVVRVVRPAWFMAQVRRPWRFGKRRSWYRSRWQRLCVAHGLADRIDSDHYRVPKLLGLELGDFVDRISVRPLFGHDLDQWAQQADAFAMAIGARGCRVVELTPGRIVLEVARADALAWTVPALPIADRVDLWALPVGVREDGTTWTVGLAGNHVLIAGVTGAGKGSVLWSIVRACAPAIAAGVVRVWAIDPKGGMELAPGRTLFARFAADEFEAMAELLDQAVAEMKARAQRFAGETRKHQPAQAEPLIVVVVDELANLTAYLPDKKLRDRISQSLSLLLTQGRAVGVCVVAALQDPRKEIVAFRNLFPTKIGLRLDEPTQVDMVLGEGARLFGARCDRIPESTPGVGFVKVDGKREPIRVRAGYVTDTDIADMAKRFPAPVATGDREPS